MKRTLLVLSMLLVPSLIAAPRVASWQWGEVKVQHDNGSMHTYRDVILYPAGSQAWDWNKTKTRHKPGIQVADLQTFINDVDVIVLSHGVEGVLDIAPNVMEYIWQSKKIVYTALTPQAIELYHELVAQGKKVGALIHSTC